MKLVVLFILAFLFQVQAGIGYAQTVSLSKHNVSIVDVFREIKKQTNYNIISKSELIRKAPLINIEIKNASLKEALDKVLIPNGLSYVIEGKSIIIGLDQASDIKGVNKTLIHVQKKEVRGEVVDDSGELLVGVSVRIKGKTTGVTTNENGQFSILVETGDVLVFSYIGFATSEQAYSGQESMRVVLNPDVQSMEDVVVIGYGTANKMDLTTSISSISEAEIMKTPITSLEQALQGNAAGVLVTNTSGEPGGEISIRVRGGSSIKADNEPLLVIDGFTSDEGLSSLNPSDIKSIEVLKDAGATAIYGSRGANGVILVTTKSGDAGKPKVNFQSYYGFQQLRRKLPLLNAAQLAELANEGRETIGSGPNTLRPDTVPSNIDWQDAMFQTAPQINNTLTVSGGDSKVRYYVSGNYINQDGLITNSNFIRTSLRSNLDFDINKIVRAGVKMNLAQISKKGIQVGDNGSILRANSTNPNQKGLLDPSGSLYLDPETGDPISTTPLANAQETINQKKDGSVQLGGYLQLKVLRNLTFKSNGTYNPTSKLNQYYYPNKISGDKVSDAYESIKQATKWSIDNVLQYTDKYKKHSYSVLAGQEMTSKFDHDFRARNTDFNTDIFTFYNLQSGNGVPTVTSGASEYNLLSYFSRATYNYNSLYLFSFTYRADGSSKFGANNRWGYFPAASFAWRASNEPFIKKMKVFSDLKFRFSYGVNGSDRISAYSSQALYTTIASAIGGNMRTGYMISKLANPDLKWEKTEEYNWGTDIAFLKGKLSLTADYYIKNTKDLLLDFGLPAASGYTTVAKNIGSVENKGWEFALTTRNLVGNFNWSTSFNAAYNQNTVADLGGPDQISAISNSSANTKFGDVVLIKVGQPLGVFWGYQTDGLFQTQAEIDATPSGLKREGVKTLPGFPKYVDQNNDGVLNDDDKIILGNPQPKWNGGMTNNFSYRSFDMSVFMVFQQGNSILNTSYTKLMNYSGKDNQLVKVLDRWRPPNPETGYLGNPSNSIPRAFNTGYQADMSNSYIEDGSYLRLKTITIGYTLPADILQRVNISSVRFYLTGTNLLTISNYYGGYDPEVSINGKKGIGAGMDNGSYPTSKMYLFGLSVNF